MGCKGLGLAALVQDVMRAAQGCCMNQGGWESGVEIVKLQVSAACKGSGVLR